MAQEKISVIIHEQTWTTPTERFNDWYYKHLLGGCTSPYMAFVTASADMEKKALWAFCQMCNKNSKCKEMCPKCYKFWQLLNSGINKD